MYVLAMYADRIHAAYIICVHAARMYVTAYILVLYVRMPHVSNCMHVVHMPHLL